MAKSMAKDKNQVKENRNIFETNFNKSLAASLPLVFPQKDDKSYNPTSRHCDVFDFVHRIGGYHLTMLVSIDEAEEFGKYDCLDSREISNVETEEIRKNDSLDSREISNVETEEIRKNDSLDSRENSKLMQSLFDKEKKKFKEEFVKFMDISRVRLRKAKNNVFTEIKQPGMYGEYISFAAYDIQETIKTQPVIDYFKCIDRRINDIVVYEFPFTRIGRRISGALYLVFVDTANLRNEKNERERHLFGSSILYRALSEINCNIWMKTRLHDMTFHERILKLRMAGTCDSYIRAVKKLAAMQRFSNFGKMVSVLAEIQYFGYKSQNWELFDPPVKGKSGHKDETDEQYSRRLTGDIDKFNKRLKQYIDQKTEECYLAEFVFTSESDHLIDPDGRRFFDTKTLHKTKIAEFKTEVEGLNTKVRESEENVKKLETVVEKNKPKDEEHEKQLNELKTKVGETQTKAGEFKARVEEPDTEVEERKKMIHLMWKTSYFHSEVTVLSDFYHGHGQKEPSDADIESADKRIDYVMSETMKLLDDVPDIVWKASNELSTQENGELKLKGHVLVLFLLTKYAEWKNSEANSEDTLLGGCKRTANCEKLMFLKHILHVIQYVLRVRDDRDIEVLRSIIWLISEFGHTALGINRHIDIENNLLLLAQQQPALFGLKDHYRDHLNHVIQVCLTGWLLLETKLGVHKLYQTFPGLKKGDAISPNAVHNEPARLKSILAKWFVASLLHDVGYITSIGDGWMKLLGAFRTPSLGTLQKEMKESLKYNINKHLHVQSGEFLPKETDYEDHGVVSALHISELIHEVNPEKYDEYFCVFHAVAFHNKSKGGIDFAADPLTVLLIICDEIQEWGRPSVDRSSLSLNLAINSQQESECWHDSIESLSINIKTDYDRNKKQLRLSLINNDPLCCTIKYSNNIYRNNSVFNVWLARSESLQRLNLKQSPLMGFSFKIESKIRENNTVHKFRKNETHMERLKRFIREEHYWKLFRWLQCVEYHQEAKCEVVKIDIDKLHDKTPVEGGMEEFWQKFSAWKDNGQPF